MAMPKIHKVQFGQDNMDILETYVKDKVMYLSDKMTGLRDELLPKWVRIYRGTPKEEEATFPWPGASNLVIQLAGTHCDELLSRVMAIWSNSPLFVPEIYDDFEKGKADDYKDILGRFLDLMAFEPQELDLYRVEETTFSSTIRYGTGIVKFPYEYMVEKQVTGVEPDANGVGKPQFSETVKRDGPHPESVPLNLFGIDPKYSTLELADFFYNIVKKDKHQMEEMLEHPEIYDLEAVERAMVNADRNSPDEFTRELQSNKKTEFHTNACAEEWDIYECWYRYRHNGDVFSLISYYHKASDTHLGTIYNFYNENLRPFEDSKLAYDDDTYFGYGLCEMLASYEEEVSKTHNWRRNNRDFATTGIGRVNKNSKLSSIVQLFPGLLIPADEGEIEPLQFGAGALQYGTEDEMLTLSLAKERSGVDPAIGGAGGGVVNSKRGIYSAQGTAAVMQQQNNRNNLRMSDMRSAHVRIGRKLLNIYSSFGIGTKSRMFGDRSQILVEALGAYKSKKLGLAIKAATASVNRELEKQNDILLASTLDRLYAGDAQMIQTMVTQKLPPELQSYYLDVLAAKNQVMIKMLRNFGRDDVDRLVPGGQFIKAMRDAQLKQQQQQQLGAGSNGGNGQMPGQGGGAIPLGGGQVSGGVPEGSALQ